MTQEQIDTLIAGAELPMALKYINHTTSLSRLLTKTDPNQIILTYGLLILKGLKLDNLNVSFTSPNSRYVTPLEVNLPIRREIVESIKAGGSTADNILENIQVELVAKTVSQIQEILDYRITRNRTLCVGELPQSIQMISEGDREPVIRLRALIGVK